MEDGPEDGSSKSIGQPEQIDDEENAGTMANFPTVDNATTPTKVNGADTGKVELDDGGSSDCDNLVIDEKPKKHKRRKEKNARQECNDDEQQLNNDQQQLHSNPYFSESIFELTNHYNAAQSEGIPKLSLKKVGSNRYAKRGARKPKMRAYGQYLGLQPSVKFRCSKCGSAGFESLQLLDEHALHCTAEAHVCSPPRTDKSSTNIKVTRKVFLCSACGTYYENWNLFLHMKEVHKRFVCLYCLGLFNGAEKLSGHLVTKHNCAPGQHDTEADYFDGPQRESCLLVCCDCSNVFNEQDAISRHLCAPDNDAPVTIHDDSKQLTESGVAVEPIPVRPTFENHLQDADVQEVRKVPKVTLKLQKITTFIDDEDADAEDEGDEEQSEDSDADEEQQLNEEQKQITHNGNMVKEENGDETLHRVTTAGADVAINELELDQPLDKIDIVCLLKKCLQATMATCSYCNHARKIHVNGKQLGLHLVAEHRYAAVVKSITAEELIPETFNARILDELDELQLCYVTLEAAYASSGHLFECLQCRFGTQDARELYTHARRTHPNTPALCIMCKTNFYSYSEFVCHLCPGQYSYGLDVPFRCCVCVAHEHEFPSGFRLMVHLRKYHVMCDVCLVRCRSASELSSHVWKHKLHHLCYRCGLTYRNKTDITRHLFWKHGTESVLCKRCLQKKWPHVYHFCFPPAGFTCDVCEVSVSKASYLKVHQRLHTNETPYVCLETGCTERFISRRLRDKHEAGHRDPPPVEPKKEVKDEDANAEANTEEVAEKPKPKVDVYDLPELKLSESDSSESDEGGKSPALVHTDDLILETSQDGILKLPDYDEEQSAVNVDLQREDHVKTPPVAEEMAVLDIWDNFKNYQANIAQHILSDVVAKEADDVAEILTDILPPVSLEIALRDHDYCPRTMDVMVEQEGNEVLHRNTVAENFEQTADDHDYCGAKETPPAEQQAKGVVATATPVKLSSTSSDSSCTCGSDCSCTSTMESSSSSDSSESDSSTQEGRKRQQERRQARRAIKHDKDELVEGAMPIRESDLETSETDSDDEFYDLEPQTMAKKIIAEKREKLVQLAATGEFVNGRFEDSPPTPMMPKREEIEAAARAAASSMRKTKKKMKRKSKKKKKKKKKRNKRAKTHHIPPIVAPLTLTLPKSSPCMSPMYDHHALHINNHHFVGHHNHAANVENSSSTRVSKRKRIPNKFYGYSSEEEQFKYRKMDSTLLVPPITIKTTSNNTPKVNPISIRVSKTHGGAKRRHLNQLKYNTKKRARPPNAPRIPPLTLSTHRGAGHFDSDSDETTSSSSMEEEDVQTARRKLVPNATALYCYCRCPYDEVSEMIGCDSEECAIEWFHFECVGIMVAPRGQWFCPDCRKRKHQEREMQKAQLK